MAKRRKNKKKGEPYGAWPILGGVGLLCIGVVVLLSVGSYDPNDVDEVAVPVNDPVENICGKLGAWAAWGLFHMVGLSAYMVAIVIVGWGALLAVGRVPTHLWLRIAGTIFLVGSLASLDSLINFSALGLPPSDELMIQEGGQVGSYFSDALTPMFGRAGSLVFFLGAFFLAAVLTADRAVFAVCAAGGSGVQWLAASAWEQVGFGYDRLLDWRDDRAERREEAREAAEAEEEYEEDEDEEEPEEEYEEEYEVDDKPVVIKPKLKPKPKKSKMPALAKGFLSKTKTATKTVTKPKVNRPMAPDFDPDSYQLPPVDLLEDPRPFDAGDLEEQIARNIEVLEQTLAEFGIEAQVVETDRGPVITLYALELAPGVKGTKVMALNNDLERALKSIGLRIVNPIPNTPYVGVEIPNAYKEEVRLKEILSSPECDASKAMLPIVLGKDASGRPIVEDLTTMPHLLIAGTTGSGKSVCLNSIIATLLMTRYPSDVKLLLVDPKSVELAAYHDIPHLLHPVVTDMKKAPQVLEWAVKKMEDRYELLAMTRTRNIGQFNKLGGAKVDALVEAAGGTPGEAPHHLPYIVIVIDELADLMMQSRKDVESHITRLAQKSRAIGIHIILATQRPSTDVITGLIKSNISARISFRVFSKVDARVILDRSGAETLLGQGDMLYLVPGTSTIVRAQGSFVSDDEINRIADFIKEQAKPEYSEELQQWGKGSLAEADKDELYGRAAEMVIDSQRGSVSMLQRALAIGYTRASRLMDQLTQGGIVGEFKGSKAREVMMTREEYDRMTEGRTAND